MAVAKPKGKTRQLGRAKKAPPRYKKAAPKPARQSETQKLRRKVYTERAQAINKARRTADLVHATRLQEDTKDLMKQPKRKGPMTMADLLGPKKKPLRPANVKTKVAAAAVRKQQADSVAAAAKAKRRRASAHTAKNT